MKRAIVSFVSLLLKCSTSLATLPLALHQLVEVGESDEVVLSLHGHDVDGDETIATITSLPSSGTLYQLSHIYNNHGHDPKFGVPIAQIPCEVLGGRSRVVYKRPEFDREINGEWGRFQYYVADREGKSAEGTVVLVPPSKIVVASDFRFSDEEWTTVGNRPNGVVHERSSRGKMSNYIYAADNSLNINALKMDIDVWYFQFPKKFHGWHGIVYGGRLEFDLSSFGGDFSPEKLNAPGKQVNLVEIDCAKCRLNKGITIGFPLDATNGFHGNTTYFSFQLVESSGWLKDPGSTLLDWTLPTKCEMIEVLSGISAVRVLGDFTTWYENTSIDNVRFVLDETKGRYQLPKCAQITPDARKCNCK